MATTAVAQPDAVFDNARRHADALLALARLASSASSDPVATLPIAARLGARILDVDRLSIHSLNGGPEALGDCDAAGSLPERRNTHWTSLLGFRAALAGGAILADRVAEDVRLRDVVTAGLVAPGIASLIAAPVLVNEEIIAVLVGERQSVRSWPPGTLADVGTIADMVGLLLSDRKAATPSVDDGYRSLVESTVDGIVLIDAKSGELVDANRAFRRLVGLPLGDLEGFLVADLLADPALITDQVKRLLDDRGEWRCETTLRFLSHPPVEVEINSHIVAFNGRPTLCAVVRSLAPRRRAERLEHDRAVALELIATGQPLDDVLEHLRHMVELQCRGLECAFVLTNDRSPERSARVESYSAPINAAVGEPHGCLVGYGLSSTADKDSLAVLKAAATLAGIALDQRALTERLAYQAQHDVLTGLPNRRLFEDRMRFALGTAKRRKTGVALFYVDLDRFKPINDTLGHDVGDQLLRAAADRISSAVRATDTVARMGGDEFTIILQDITGAAPAARVAQKVLDALKTPFDVAGHELQITGSIGIALFPQDATDAGLLQRHADVAMYRAKNAGGNGFRWFTTEMNDAATERKQVEVQLRRVIEKGELSLFYQTQVSLDGTTRAVEAFVRWQHPQLGFVLPAHFIPVAEECGLIVPIGTWVLREACRQLVSWQAMGAAPDKLSINISSVQFAQADFVDVVAQILQETGVQPARIELEVTESLLMRDFEKSIERLAQLRKLGVSVAIDDFGTGQFSLSHLHQLPIDVLKVDKSFVNELGRSSNTLAMVETIIALAKSLRLRVVAEGVENEEQLAILRKIGCDRAQGYLFGRAVGATELLPTLRSSIPPPRRPQADGARERTH